MQMTLNKKLCALIGVTVIAALFYLFVGLDYEIFDYQFQSRFRKFILIILVGGAIGTSVVVFQAITRNRLLTPSIMGLDSVYLFAKVIPIFLLGAQSQFVTNIYLNFALTLVGMVLFALILFQFMFKVGNFSVYFILLVGVILGTFFRSITSFIQLIMDPDSFLAVQSAMFANFDASNSNLVIGSAYFIVHACHCYHCYFTLFRCLTAWQGTSNELRCKLFKGNTIVAYSSGFISFYIYGSCWSYYFSRITNGKFGT